MSGRKLGVENDVIWFLDVSKFDDVVTPPIKIPRVVSSPRALDLGKSKILKLWIVGIM